VKRAHRRSGFDLSRGKKKEEEEEAEEEEEEGVAKRDTVVCKYYQSSLHTNRKYIIWFYPLAGLPAR
jgi:hypothetical protein